MRRMGEKTISTEIVEHVAWLARIKLSDKEKRKFSSQLSKILEYFSRIDEVDTSNVEPMFHVLDISNVFREDEVAPSMPLNEVLRNVPESEKGFIKAPRII
ncbi:MAG: Asp-tRNA(Asn)/Glu-tRNA(Gln) amidotransferase subunit GatC [Candidatus Freyarchaeota archaeon]|nr:Asp-tRNA(Asn)/Glu-tRNA(Gln) amidotransferase subunit GatC [Candidatus Freyrarchaeum guaymaensis]